jgi:hypothetical protein
MRDGRGGFSVFVAEPRDRAALDRALKLPRRDYEAHIWPSLRRHERATPQGERRRRKSKLARKRAATRAARAAREAQHVL